MKWFLRPKAQIDTARRTLRLHLPFPLRLLSLQSYIYLTLAKAHYGIRHEFRHAAERLPEHNAIEEWHGQVQTRVKDLGSWTSTMVLRVTRKDYKRTRSTGIEYKR